MADFRFELNRVKDSPVVMLNIYHKGRGSYSHRLLPDDLKALRDVIYEFDLKALPEAIDETDSNHATI